MLELRNVHAAYRANEVLHGVSLTVPEGSISVLLGANGAGKSTTLRAILGGVRRTRGSVIFDGTDITADDVPTNVRRGIGLVPEGGRVFTDFTIERNLRLGAFTVKDNDEYERRLEDVFSIFPLLGDRIKQRASTLSGGERQMLAIGRALMSQPRLLMLDEPFLGLAPVIIDTVIDAIAHINQERGVTLFVVEQNAQILKIATGAFAMRLGEIVLNEPEPRRLMTGDGARQLEAAFIG